LVKQFFQNAQAGNYAFAKALKAQQNRSGNSSEAEGSSHHKARTGTLSQQVPTSAPRRGRPPNSALAVVINSASATPLRRQSRTSGFTSSRSNSPNTSSKPRKKLGRPFKTPEAAARAAAKAARRANGPVEVKKRGRPFSHRTQPNIPVPETIFHPFLCEWLGCTAELHNLEALRTHIKIVHRKRNENKMLLCQWGKCYTKRGILGIVQLNGMQFGRKEDWATHIAETHILPIAWQMGDGPKGTDLGTVPSLPLILFKYTHTWKEPEANHPSFTL
jgi:hypothetical protein